MKKNTAIGILAAMLQFQLKPASAAEHVIEIINFKYSPAELTINRSDTVTWVNRDFVPHNVSAGSNGNWRSPDLLKGQIFSIVVTAEIPYVCSLHEAVMQGTILLADE